jgi:hypothetical protein
LLVERCGYIGRIGKIEARLYSLLSNARCEGMLRKKKIRLAERQSNKQRALCPLLLSTASRKPEEEPIRELTQMQEAETQTFCKDYLR